MKKFLLAFSIFSVLVFSPVSFVMAQDSSGVQNNKVWDCKQLQAELSNYGGKDSRATALPAYCQISEVYNKISSVLYFIVGIIATLAIIYGGFTYMTARENDTQKKKGKDVILYALLGLTIAILAIVIINVVINLVVENRFS